MSGLVPGNRTILYNYGSPRVGNYAFAEKVVNSIPIIYRINHYKDQVPHIPFCTKDTKGNCVTGQGTPNYNKTGILFWDAWHIWNEVFYDENFTRYTICNTGESKECADQFTLVQTTASEHWNYLNVTLPCYGKPYLEVPSLAVEDVIEEEEEDFLEIW